MSDAETGIAKTKSRGKRRPSLGRLIDDFIILASGQLFSKIFGFLAFAWLARTLTVENYGAVETAVGMAAIGAIALEMGTGAVGVRRISQENASPRSVLGAVITGRLGIAIIAAPLLAAFYILVTKSTAPDLLFLIFAASLFAMPFNHNWYFQAHERMGIAGFGQTLKMALFFAGVIIFAPQRNGVLFGAYAELIAAFAMAGWFSFFGYRMIRPHRPDYSLDGGVKLLQESAQLGASSFVNALAQYLPILVVAAAANDAETARFGASQRLVISLMTFSYIYYFNLFPLIARKMADNLESLDRIVSASVRVTAWAGVIAASILTALAPQIMQTIFGREFVSAGLEFSILAWSGAIALASGNARWLLVAGKRQESLLAAQIVNAVLVVSFGYFLSLYFGGVGASLGCIIGACGLWFIAHTQTKGLTVRAGLIGNLPPALTAAAVLISLTITKFGPMQSVVMVFALLTVGVFADRKLMPAARALINAKSAT